MSIARSLVIAMEFVDDRAFAKWLAGRTMTSISRRSIGNGGCDLIALALVAVAFSPLLLGLLGLARRAGHSYEISTRAHTCLSIHGSSDHQLFASVPVLVVLNPVGEVLGRHLV